MRTATLMGLAAVGLGACAVTTVEPLSIPLVYKAAPATPGLPRIFSCAAVSGVQAEDKRTEKILGVRFHETKPLKAQVTASNDAAAWTHDGVVHMLWQNGLRVAGSGPQLDIALNGMHTSENVWHRSGYEAKIALDARLQSPSGKTCWEETVEGASSNYGYSGSIENYQETLNSALDAATLHLLDSPKFKDALCHCAD